MMKKKRVLMVATVPSMIGQFNMDNIKMLLDIGYKVEVATNFIDTSVWPEEKNQNLKNQLIAMNIDCINIDFSREFWKMNKHLQAYRELLKLIKERNYSFIHTHTPIASAIVRLVAYKTKTKVIYTAHGFHFYNGAPLQNWLFYYPLEKWMSRYTDVLITINKEDHKRANEQFYARKTVYCPGVGVDTEKFGRKADSRKRIRLELGVTDQEIVILSVGELNRNKNHEVIIKAISGMDIVYVIVGKGKRRERLREIAKECGVKLRLMGYRSDVSDIYSAADIYVLPSIREGLNVSLMEAMASGLPCVASNIRGTVDLIDNQCLLVASNDVKGFAKIINRLKEISLIEEGKRNKEKIRKFDKNIVLNEMREIYKEENETGSRSIGDNQYE